MMNDAYALLITISAATLMAAGPPPSQPSLPLALGHRYSDVRAVFTNDDYPADLLRAGKSGTVSTRTTVRPDGSIQGCAVERSSGIPSLDAYTCAIILKRARFAPAKWTDGSAAYGVIRVPVSWVVSYAAPSKESMFRATNPDLELSVNHLPQGARQSFTAVSLEVAADENGRPVTCVEWSPPKNARGAYFPELVPIACNEVMATLKLIPPLDASGKAARSVQSVLVNFELDH
jgi:TonB family protein